MPDPINPSRPETGLPVTPTDTGVSEELAFKWDDEALDAALSAYFSTKRAIPDGEAAVRAAIRGYTTAIAPRLKAEGMRMAKEGLPQYWQDDIDRRADALSPPVKETK